MCEARNVVEELSKLVGSQSSKEVLEEWFVGLSFEERLELLRHFSAIVEKIYCFLRELKLKAFFPDSVERGVCS